MALLTRNTIKSGVMKVINEKINEAQVRYEADCVRLEDEKEQSIRDALVLCDSGKTTSAMVHIKSIIGKLI